MSRAASKPTPENVVAFQGGLRRVTTDRDGESLVTFEVPLSALDEVAKLQKWPGKLLTVYVKRQEA